MKMKLGSNLQELVSAIARERSLLASVIVLVTSSAGADVINVKSYGAKGDGISNDQPAIQSAINACTNGATLYIPAGRYLLAAAPGQTYSLLLTQTNVTINGDGPGSVLVQSNFATTVLYANFTTTAAGFAVQNMKFQADMSANYDSNPDPTSGWLLRILGIGRDSGWSKIIRITNVTTDDLGKRSPIYMGGLDDVVIENCRFTHFQSSQPTGPLGYPSIMAAGYYSVGSIRLINNFFDGGVFKSGGVTYGADGLFNMQGGYEAVVIGNTIRNFKYEAVQVDAARVTVNGNTFLTTNSPSSTAVAVTPNGVWEDTNVQYSVCGNVASGCMSFLSDQNNINTNIIVDCVVANNTVSLGNRSTYIQGWVAVSLRISNRMQIHGNTFDNYGSPSAFVLGGTGKSDSSLIIEGNVLTTPATNSVQCAMWLNFPPVPSPANYTSIFKNMIIQNNTINIGTGYPSSWHIFIYGNKMSTNTPGRIIMGNNIYTTSDNTYGPKVVGIQNSSSQYIVIHPGTTNWGNYTITDLGPDY